MRGLNEDEVCNFVALTQDKVSLESGMMNRYTVYVLDLENSSYTYVCLSCFSRGTNVFCLPFLGLRCAVYRIHAI